MDENGNPTDGPVTAYAQDGKTPVGTYKYDPATGKITFHPNDDFDGDADPLPVKLRAWDKNGLSTEGNDAQYQPHFKNNTKTVTRRIDYKYDNGDPVLDEDGNPIVIEQKVTFTFKVDPKTGELIDPTPKTAELPAEVSPAVDGWIPATNGVEALTVTPEDNPADVTVYYSKPPVGGEKITYGGKEQTQKGTPTFTEGSKKLVSFTLIDPTTGEAAKDNKVTIPGEGTYTLNPETGEVTFVPEPDFTGKATTVTVEALDENLNKAEGFYTPIVVDNEETVDKVQKIEYFYDDGTPVLDEDGNPRIRERAASFSRRGQVDPENGTIIWPEWVSVDLNEEVSPEIEGYMPDKGAVPAREASPVNWPADEKVIYSKIHWVIYIDPATGRTIKEKTDFNDKNGEPPAPADPTREGYTFDGWEREVDADGNITYRAKWRKNEDPAKTIWVTYIDPDGTVYMPKTNFADGEDEPAGPEDPAKEGFTFDGWNRSVDADGNITYIAKWKSAEKPAEKTTVKKVVRKAGAPKTGDSGSVFMWMAIAGAASSVGVLTFAFGRGQRRKGRR